MTTHKVNLNHSEELCDLPCSSQCKICRTEGKSLKTVEGSKRTPEDSTSNIIDTGQDFLPFNTTCCFLLERKHFIQSNILPCIPNDDDNLCIKC